MNYRPTPAEHRLLWLLVANQGQEFDGVLKPTKATRDALRKAKFIDVERREKPSRGKRKTKVMYLRLTDAGWAWCNQDMSWPLPRNKTKADLFLNSLLKRLQVLFAHQSTAASLGDFINKSALDLPPSPGGPAATQSGAAFVHCVPRADLEQKIRAACLDLGGGRQAVRIRIADLRERLSEIAHDQLTQGLRDLARRNELTLYPYDNPRNISSEDEAAAVHSSTGVPQHILYFGGIAS